MERIVKENIAELDNDLAVSWIELAANEMIQTRVIQRTKKVHFGREFKKLA
jgi:hypothetical protein